MSLIGESFRRLWYRVNRGRIDAALQREMESHRAEMGDARRFGNARRLREEAHDVWGWQWLDHLARDVRLAARTLRRSPGFTVTSIVSLAIGFTLAASTLAVLNAYLLRSLPYANAGRLYNVMYAPPGPWEPRNMEAIDWRSVADVVEFPITASGTTFYLGGDGPAQAIRGLRGGPGLIEGLGVRVTLGRTLTPADFAVNAEPTALLGYHLWRDRYGADPAVVGRQIRAEPDGGGPPESFVVAGVLTPDFYFGRDSSARVDLLIPLTAARRTYLVRLREGVPPDFAARRLTAAARDVAIDLPADWSGVRLESARERYIGQLRPVLTGVTAAAAIVLIVVCANVGVLMVLRAARRQKEIAVRASLGAERRHIARMLVAEGALLCVSALGLALLLTSWLLGGLGPIIETELGRPAPGGPSAIALDRTVLLIAGGAGTLIALALPFLPLIAPWQRRIAGVLQRVGNATTDGRATRRLRSGLIAFEVAGTLVLFIGCGLLLRSAGTMLNTELGFEPEGLARGRVVLRAADYADAPAFFRFYERFAERLGEVTGGPVVFSNWPPFFDLPIQSVEADGRAGGGVAGGVMEIGPGYFSALAIPLDAGREFTRQDAATARPVAVVSASLAGRLWPGQSALGRQVRTVLRTEGGATPGPWRTVVGTAGDVRQQYADPNVADVYVPIAPASVSRFGSYYVRTARPVSSVLAAAQSVAAEIDPHAVADPPRTVVSQNRELAGTTFLTSMLSGFAIVAGGLALLGIYGVTAYGVQQRQREIAIRMALGAPGGRVIRLFVVEGLIILAVGLVIGLAGAGGATRILEHQLFAVGRFDPLTLAATTGLLAAAGLAATWWPARRAAHASPTRFLRDG